MREQALGREKRNGKTAMRLHVNMSSGLSTDDLCSVAYTNNSGESGGTRIKDSCTRKGSF